MQGNSNKLWPGEDDTQAIEAMRDDTRSDYDYHWQECQIFINGLVKKRASNFSKDDKEEICQNALLRIVRSLPTFKRESRLTTWITKITINCITDAGRMQQAQLKQEDQSLHSSEDADEDEDLIYRIKSPRTTEDNCIFREDVREIKEKLREYFSKHGNKERTIRIFTMHLEGLSQKEIASILDMPVPNVGYTIRAIQKFLGKSI